ncbi:hypothetical protein D3C75_1237860 [compost metagenome]
MVGTHHQTAFITCNGVLSDHPGTRFDVPFDKVDLVFIASVLTAQRAHHGVNRLADIDSQGFIRTNEAQRFLSVFFVALHVEGQTHGVILRGIAFST